MRRTVEPEQDWSQSSAGRTFGGLPALAVAGFGLAVKLLSFHWLWGRWKNKVEAKTELKRIVAEHGGHDYESWRSLVNRTKRLEFRTQQGTWYQATISPVWDDEPNGTIRVLFALDDGGSSAFFPMTDSLLVKPPTSMPDRAVQQ